ncbi:MAG: HD domain-containing protein [Propionibacteriaceae bacterium]|jgi:dGTPase|nr:HD domain-containing protein [Propionibacteriaceae bacterium]
MQTSSASRIWASTMHGHQDQQCVTAHQDSKSHLRGAAPIGRIAREDQQDQAMAAGATRAQGAGRRRLAEDPDPWRTCFQRDADRIIHSSAFRRLAGKTQVVVFPLDHQRTRLTHALEVSQVAEAVARGVGANVDVARAIALGHDCGHGPGGHAAETAFARYLPDGYQHGPWGADVVLRPLNLCAETLDGIRRHSWSEPAPATVEGEIVSWADRIAYCCHDLEDATHAGVIDLDQLPTLVVELAGRRRSQQLRRFITALIENTVRSGLVSMSPGEAEALAALRQFNYDHIYMRPASQEQSTAVITLLRALTDYYIEHPSAVPALDDPPEVAGVAGDVVSAVVYVAGMTDRFAFHQARNLLDYDLERIPAGIGRED